MATLDRDVLIISAGPIGCVAALILTQAGLGVELIEAHSALPVRDAP